MSIVLKIRDRLNDYMNYNEILYKFNIVDQEIFVCEKKTDIIVSVIYTNKINIKSEISPFFYKMNEKYKINNSNLIEFNFLQYTNSLISRTLSTI